MTAPDLVVVGHVTLDRFGDQASAMRMVSIGLIVAGIVGLKLLGMTPAIRGLLKPDLSISLIASSVAIAVAVGILSGLYPAWRSSRLTPSRH